MYLLTIFVLPDPHGQERKMLFMFSVKSIWIYDKRKDNIMTIEEIVHGESQNVEFKVTLPKESEKYTKTIVAFANTQGNDHHPMEIVTCAILW
mgnify:FL=1